MRILDVGFGTGLSDEYFDAQIVGVEPSKGMLNEYQGDAETHQAKAEDIDKLFQPNSFDAALSVSTAHHFERVKQVFTSIQTFVKDNGLILISCFPDTIQKLTPELTDRYHVLHKEELGREIAVILKKDR
jgi:ubiquinone/menaquinone biosynthesis C-methylase UbiE